MSDAPSIPSPAAIGSQRVTLRLVREWARRGDKFAVLTCYDATTARWLAQGGVPVLLVGDSAAQVVLGFDQSIFAPLEFMLTITAAVRRGAPSALVMGDMPFMSYQADEGQAVTNAGRFLTEGLADLVKLEVDRSYAGLVAKMSRAGIPVVAHLGWRPQRVRFEGLRTAKVAGKTSADIAELVLDAQAMEDHGAVMLLLEQCTAEAAQAVADKVALPIVGCGAGPACHGHVVVLQDLLGLSERHPSFVQPLAALGGELQKAAGQWVQLIASGRYLRDDHPYHMSPTPQT